jgi:outer membrane protein TolC
MAAAATVLLPLIAAGCADLPNRPLPPSVAPADQQAASLKVDTSTISPMYRRLLAVDLPTVIKVADTQNLDIQEAQQRVEGSRGAYEASVGALFPTITPQITAMDLSGAISQPGGGVEMGHFSNLLPSALLQWVINPGQVVYDLIASKRRLEASAQQEQAVIQETLRSAAAQYYDLVLAQAQVSVGRQAVDEARELLRLEQLRLKTGTGLPADELRAEAAEAGAEQQLLIALKRFYDGSVALSVTLHLDSTVMLVPQAGTMRQTTLVRDDLPIDDMLSTAVRYRPDLEAVRTLWAATQADKGSAIWGGLGPKVQAAGTFEPSAPTSSPVDTMYRQQRYLATGGFTLSAATFGRIKSAVANTKIAGLDLDLKLDQVQAAVVSAHQATLTAAKAIPVASRQVASAEEALRLTQANLEAGTALTIDMLQAEAAADRARFNYADAVVGYNKSQVNLLAALGVLDRESLTEQPMQETQRRHPNLP